MVCLAWAGIKNGIVVKVVLLRNTDVGIQSMLSTGTQTVSGKIGLQYQT